jgi:hypothetical protein
MVGFADFSSLAHTIYRRHHYLVGAFSITEIVPLKMILGCSRIRSFPDVVAVMLGESLTFR